ncbi:MAG: antibiotic biosynthesis monooxygenase [Maritimibacter sp.]|nr:antibiotic biosynthesis monooxygenase [Maritimibacter sp.]
MPPIRLVGHIDVPPERRAAVAAALPEHISLTRAEPGCRAFDVTADASVPGRFLVAEVFDDRAAFDAHQARSRDSAWGALSDGLVRHYTIEETAP